MSFASARRATRRSRPAMAVLLAVVVLATACGEQTELASSSADPSSSATGVERADLGTTPTPRAARLGGDRPGALLRRKRIEVEPLTTQGRATAYQVQYLSEDLDGRPVRTLGTVLIPTGTPPEGGWPVVAYGHPSTGIIPPCAPSRFADLAGSVGAAAPLIRLGNAVVISDYQGMDDASGGYQPFLVPAPGAADLTDLVVAARRLSPQLSRRWVALGLADGANAAWAANAEAARAPKRSQLQLVGTVSVSPLVGVADLADLAAAGELSRAQYPLLLLALQTLSQEVPDFDLERYRSPQLKRVWPRFFQCGGLQAPALNPLFKSLGPDQLGPRDVSATDELRSALRLFSLAGRRWQPTAPMLVLYGGRDTTIPPEWVKDRLAAVCRRDGVVTQSYDASSTRDSVDTAMVANWITDRFAGRRPTNSCGRLR